MDQIFWGGSNAKCHEDTKWFLNIDIGIFFSITFPRILGLFQSPFFKCDEKIATCLARICTYKDRIPQDAKASPILANIVAYHLDKILVKLARDENIRYSRYAGGVTSSSTRHDIPKSLARDKGPKGGERSVALGRELRNCFRSARFKINDEKTRIQFQNERMMVTGLIVNQKTNIMRKDVSRLRMILYSSKKYGPSQAAKIWIGKNANADKFWSYISGWLSHVRQIRGVDDPVLAKLCKQAASQNENLPRWIVGQADMVKKFDVLLSHASEDKDAVRKLFEKMKELYIELYFDDDSIKWETQLLIKSIRASCNRLIL